MSEQDFELYLTLLAKTLRLSDKQRDAIASELRDHLEARLDELTAEGLDKHQAIKAALAEFGDASALANDFTTIGKHHQRRRIMQTAFGTIATAAVVGFAAITLTPTNYQGNPAQPKAGAQDDAAAGGGAGTTGSGEGAATLGVRPGGLGGMEFSAAEPRRELAIQAVVRDAPQLTDLSIHVVDCTEILSPRADGLDLLDRTESLARAVAQTVGAVRPHGPEEIHVQAFEEFLIITATDEAYAQAQDLLENISSHVQRRDLLQHERDAAETREAVSRIQNEIELTLAELRPLEAERNAIMQEIESRIAEGRDGDGSEIRQLRSMLDELSVRQDVLRHRRENLERRRAELLPFGGC